MIDPVVFESWRVRVVKSSVVLSGLAVVGLGLVSACSRNSAAAPRRGGGEGGPVPVVTAKVAQKNVPVDIAAIGNVEASTTITIQSQVTGTLIDVLFHEGDVEKKGQHLFTIDPRPFEAALQQAQANLTRDQA